jgi:putative hydrolase of the HAD superfamily
MPKAVLFDLDDTLYDTTRQVDTAREDAVEAMISAGLPATKEKALKKLAEVVMEKGSNYPGHFDELLIQLGAGPNPKIVAAGIIAYHKAKIKHLHPYADAIPALLALRKKGMKLAVVTDGVPVKQWEKLIRLGLSDFFDEVVIAPDGEEQKPSPSPFLKAAKNLKIPPADCIVVGDRLDKDIAGGKKAGMKTIRVELGRYGRKKPSKPEETPDKTIARISDIENAIHGI